MYLVAGATGHTGRIVASELLKQGKEVRVLVRSEEKGEPWKAKGAEVAVTSLDDVAGLVRALHNVKGFYFMVPPNPKSEDISADYRRFAKTVKEALDERSIERGVFLSTWAAHRPDGPFPMHRETEDTLGLSDTPFTFLRASFFMENTEQFLTSMQDEGVLPSFFRPQEKLPMVSARDIGEVAAAAMLGQPKPPVVIELTGPDDYNMYDVAAAFSRVLRKPVYVDAVPRDATIQTLVQNGATQAVAEFYNNMIGAFEKGRITPEGGAAIFKRGKITLETFVERALTASIAKRATVR
jgi:uncharacterized protein YbjT (DUF2867 family)